MARAKKVDIKEFNSLSQTQQKKALKNLAKRANVRLSLLEEKGEINQLYKYVDTFNKNQGREKNRFYEGIKYSGKEIKETFNILSSFLNDELSTLGGVKHTIQNNIKGIIKKGNIDADFIKKLPRQEKIYAVKELAKKSNSRLRSLEKAEYLKGAYNTAKEYNADRNKNRYYTGTNFAKGEMNKQIDSMVDFLNQKTSTVRYNRKIDKQRFKTFIDKFKEKGLEESLKQRGIEFNKTTAKEFNNFLKSKQFDTLAKYGDSETVLETFFIARNKGIELEEISDAFSKFLNENIGLDEVQERLKIAEWEEGGLLH